MTFTPRIVRSVQCFHTQFFRGRGCSVRSQARASRRHWRAVLSRKRRSKRRARFRCLRDSPATARRHSCLWLRMGNSSAWSSARSFACYTWPRSAAGKLPICHWATSYGRRRAIGSCGREGRKTIRKNSFGPSRSIRRQARPSARRSESPLVPAARRPSRSTASGSLISRAIGPT